MRAELYRILRAYWSTPPSIAMNNIDEEVNIEFPTVKPGLILAEITRNKVMDRDNLLILNTIQIYNRVSSLDQN